MSNEWDTLSKSGTILLKAARLLALSIHRLSATTSRIFLRLSRRVGTGIGRDGRRRTRQLELEMGGQAPTVSEIPAERSLLSDKLLIPKS
ncbi:hypothetical protein ALC62_06012 [Cyphomyrmex costatus]|uniref:Uncharacterized protein n=1 Tax=Cyphomyrmex costatus TaxID=456900 RepID=A0A195CR82_9HYME|nr:hypothetical protein ALC62_06012 [Cyphomyrmex costatus]